MNNSKAINENFTHPINETGDKDLFYSIRPYKDSTAYIKLELQFDDEYHIVGFDNLPTLDGRNIHHFIIRTQINDLTESYSFDRPIHVITYQCSRA